MRISKRRTDTAWYAFAALEVVSALIAIRIGVAHLMGAYSVCSGPFGCNEVLSSRFAAVGPVPVALVGAAADVAILLLASYWAQSGSSVFLKSARLLVMLKLFIGTLLQAVSVVVLRALCGYCMAYYLASVLEAALLLVGVGASLERPNPSPLFSWTLLVAAGGLWVNTLHPLRVPSQVFSTAQLKLLLDPSSDRTAMKLGRGAKRLIAFAGPTCSICAQELPWLATSITARSDVTLVLHWVCRGALDERVAGFADEVARTDGVRCALSAIYEPRIRSEEDVAIRRQKWLRSHARPAVPSPPSAQSLSQVWEDELLEHAAGIRATPTYLGIVNGKVFPLDPGSVEDFATG